jgi:hypothetical protein
MTYTDYDGNERTEDFYFNLNKAEIVEIEVSQEGGLIRVINKLMAEQDGKKIIEIFKEILFKAYGEKSLDGRRFVKSKELSEAFSQTEAYSDLFMELSTDGEAAAAFMNAIIPEVKDVKDSNPSK